MLDVGRLCGGTSQSKEFKGEARVRTVEKVTLSEACVEMRGNGIHSIGMVGSGWLLTSVLCLLQPTESPGS